MEQVTREVVLKKKPTAEAGAEEAARRPQRRDRAAARQHQDRLHQPATAACSSRTTRSCPCGGGSGSGCCGRWTRRAPAPNCAPNSGSSTTPSKKTADLPLGNVVERRVHLRPHQDPVLQSGVLLQEISETIARQKQEDDGELRYQLCALIFLIGQLPHQRAGRRGHPCQRRDARRPARHRPDPEQRRAPQEGAGAAGEAGRRRGGHAGRERVPDADPRRERVEPGVPGGAEQAAERRRQARQRAVATAHDRSAAKSSRSSSWSTATARSRGRSTCTSAPTPPDDGRLERSRSGSATAGRSRRRPSSSDARAAGDSAAVVYGYIPKKKAEELKQAIASYYAATTTLQAKGTPADARGHRGPQGDGDPPGAGAADARQPDQRHPQRARRSTSPAATRSAACCWKRRSRTRPSRAWTGSIPQFHQADSPDWHKVIERAKKGDGDALAAVGHKGDPENHPVCKAVLDLRRQRQEGDRDPQAVRRRRRTAGPRTPSTPP